MSPQAQTLDDLMAQHGAVSAPAAADPLDALMAQHGAAVPDFRQTDTSPNDVAPNSMGTFVSHLATQVNPIAAVQTIGKALLPEFAARLVNKADQAVFGSKPITDAEASTYGPLNAISHIGDAQGAVFDKAKAAYAKGDYVAAARHFVNYLTPLAGPGVDKSSDLFQAGHWAAGGGDALGIGLAMFGPAAIAKAVLPDAAPTFLAKTKATPAPGLLAPSNPVDAAAVQFGRARGIPIDAGTATGNMAVRGVQAMADRSLGGSVVASRAGQAQAEALGRVGGDLADQARGASVTPEQAGQGIRDALASKLQAHGDLADASYEKLRQLEADPKNQREIQVGKPNEWTVYHGTANAFDSFTDPPSGKAIWLTKNKADAERYAEIAARGGGKPRVVSATVEPLKNDGTARYATLTERMMPSKAIEQLKSEGYDGFMADGDPVVFKGSQVKVAPTQTIGLSVDTRAAKQALKPVYDQMTRQMPLTQRQASPGLQALDNIINGPDLAPLSQVDRDLSAIKAIARQQGGLAKFAAGKLDAAVQEAAARGGPDVVRALHTGRQATIAKVVTQDLVDALPGGKLEEPVAVFNRATAPNDGGIELLRAVADHTPQAVPQIARAKLDAMLTLATERGGFDHADALAAEWQKLGPETKKLLYPEPGQTAALDNFFLLAKRLATNPNHSGTAQGVMRLSEGAAFWANPLAFVVAETGAAGLSALLHGPQGVPILTRAVSIAVRPQVATAAQRSATAAALMRAAEAVGVPLQVPLTATSGSRQP